MKGKDEVLEKFNKIITFLESDNYQLATKEFDKLVKEYPYYQYLEGDKNKMDKKIVQFFLDLDSHLKNQQSVSIEELKEFYRELLESYKIKKEIF